jgi:hypothetical protein
VILTWDEPWNGGAAILSYTISFLESDSVTFTEVKSICDGALSNTIATRSCTILSETFTEAPYSLEWGAHIFAKVLATNVKGDSIESFSGNGAQILRVPDAPVSL